MGYVQSLQYVKVPPFSCSVYRWMLSLTVSKTGEYDYTELKSRPK